MSFSQNVKKTCINRFARRVRTYKQNGNRQCVSHSHLDKAARFIKYVGSDENRVALGLGALCTSVPGFDLDGSCLSTYVVKYQFVTIRLSRCIHNSLDSHLPKIKVLTQNVLDTWCLTWN